MVLDGSRPIAQVARDLGIVEQTLRNWVNSYRDAHPQEEEPLTLSERARLRELERETGTCGCRRNSWKKAAAYFAQDHR